jgi:hypothetical protein
MTPRNIHQCTKGIIRTKGLYEWMAQHERLRRLVPSPSRDAALLEISVPIAKKSNYAAACLRGFYPEGWLKDARNGCGDRREQLINLDEALLAAGMSTRMNLALVCSDLRELFAQSVDKLSQEFSMWLFALMHCRAHVAEFPDEYAESAGAWASAMVDGMMPQNLIDDGALAMTASMLRGVAAHYDLGVRPSKKIPKK